jgi:hypothetical protein
MTVRCHKATKPRASRQAADKKALDDKLEIGQKESMDELEFVLKVENGRNTNDKL